MTQTAAPAEQQMSKRRKRIAKLKNPRTYSNLLTGIFRYGILIGLAFIIIFPFISNICTVFMSESDLYDTMVRFIPKSPTMDNILFMVKKTDYFRVLGNTVLLSTLCGLLQTFFCSMVGYGLASFRFRGRGMVFVLVMITMLVPNSTILSALYQTFRNFDILGLFQLLQGKPIRLIDSIWAMLVLSVTCLALKNGLYIFVFRQYYKNVPSELAEAAKVDGAGTLQTYFRIVWPMASNISLTIFLLSFAWQWTDTVYSTMFFQNKFTVLSNIASTASNLVMDGVNPNSVLASCMTNTALFLIVLPLLLFFLIAQRSLVQGIEHSGLVG